MTVGSNRLYFTYAASGAPATVMWNNVLYYYVTNPQGDVLGIVNSSGVRVATYYYDAWGNVCFVGGSMASTLGTLNPLRYRGYVYDEETQLYYLQSRYYNPEWGRFINADTFVSTGQGLLGNNMFAYCRNNPVSRKDIHGTYDLSYYFDDESPWDELTPNIGRSSGSAGGSLMSSFKATLQSAANGLNMAMGQRDMSKTQQHHIFSDKSQKYTPQFNEIAARYDYSLNSQQNIVSLPGHKGRHTVAYHDLMLWSIKELDTIANGNTDIFMVGIEVIAELFDEYPLLPYAKYK